MELALILPFFLILLTFPLFLGRAYWHYSVIERAARDAARYLSMIPLSEMKNPARAPTLAAVAGQIVNAEVAELAPGPAAIIVTVSCDTGQCAGYSVPLKVRVTVQVQVWVIFFSNLTSVVLPLTADVTYPYLAQ